MNFAKFKPGCRCADEANDAELSEGFFNSIPTRVYIARWCRYPLLPVIVSAGRRESPTVASPSD